MGILKIKETEKKIHIWMFKMDLKREASVLIFAAQEQALRTKYIDSRIDNTSKIAKCKCC